MRLLLMPGSSALFIIITFLSSGLRPTDAADPPPDVTTCGNLTAQTNHTACPEFFSCCQHGWSESEGSWGCAPYPDAVCCPSRYYACPSGHTCQESGTTPPWKDEVVCLPPEDAPDGTPTRKAEEICKNGPPVLMDESRKNVIVIGDSVSIGLTPFVAESLEDIAQVVHSPWDLHDGGASDAGYGYRCLTRFLTAADGTPLRPDLLYFNWGIHSAVPGSDEAERYAKYLSWIVQELTEWARSSSDDEDPVKLLFAITSPWLNDKDKDDVIVEHNKQAKRLMNMFDIPTVNLHGPIIAKCGEPPQAACFNKTECWSPHCEGEGYEWLASTVLTPAIRELLTDKEEAATIGSDEISLAIE